MAERSNAHDSKSCDAGMYPRVQIPFSAPRTGRVRSVFFCRLSPEIGVETEFGGFFALVFVHDVRVYVGGHL